MVLGVVGCGEAVCFGDSKFVAFVPDPDFDTHQTAVSLP